MTKKLISSLLLPILCLTSSANATNVTPKETSNKSVVEKKSQNKVFEKVKNFVKSPTGKKSLYIGLPTLGVIGTVCIVAGIVYKKKKQHDPHDTTANSKLEEANKEKIDDQNKKKTENNENSLKLKNTGTEKPSEKNNIIEIKKDKIEENTEPEKKITKEKKTENKKIIKKESAGNIVGNINKSTTTQLKKQKTLIETTGDMVDKYGDIFPY